MRGQLKVGRWFPFRARQVPNPHRGFVWAARAAFIGLAFAYAPEVDAGQPTPFMGLFERIAFSAYFLWVSVLAVALWRTRADQHGK
jgi:hypothetical protein